MANAGNAVIYLEQGQALVDYTAMTDSGNLQTFNFGADVLSGKSGFAPVIRPNGIVSGRNLVSPGAANTVSVLGFTAYSQGVLNTVAPDTALAITRPATNVARVISITMTSAGALAAVNGTDGAGATFVETRGAAGGPPYILADSVEIAQVRVNTAAIAVVTTSEIFQIVGQHAERSDFPVFSVSNVGKGQAAPTGAEETAHIKFASALPASHTGDASKKTYARYFTPIFGEMARTLDFTPAETSHSVSSTQYYNGTIGSKSSTLGQGSFTALLDNGVVDGLVADKDSTLTVKFLPNRDNTPYILTQGTIGISRTFPVSDQIQADVTITAETPSAEFAG